MRSLHLGLVIAAFAYASPAGAQILSGEGAPIIPIATDEDYRAAVATSVSEYIVPGYANLSASTHSLVAATGAFCAAANSATAVALRAAFADTAITWAGVDFFRFGPMAREGRYERFAYFPDVHGTGARQIRQFLASENQALLAPGALAEQSAAVQGLPALESLLYSGSKALLAADQPEAFRCSLALAVANNIDEIAGEVVADWQAEDGWSSLINNPGPENPVYRTHAEAMTEVLKAIVTGLEQDRDQRLLPALGDTPEASKASRAPYNASGQALPYLAASAEAIERFVSTTGMLAMLPADQKAYGASVLFEFSNLRSALDAAGPDLEAALADPDRRGKLTYATVVLQSIRDLMQRHVAVAAGLTAGFNSLDGD